MEQCSICLDNLDSTGPTLACGHRFHAACLARLAGANGTTPTRRGALTACPNCRTVSRVTPTPSCPPPPADEDGAPVQTLLEALDSAASAPRHVLLQNCDDDEDDGVAFGIETSATSFSARGRGNLRAPPAAPTSSTRRAHTRSSGPPPPPAPRVSDPPPAPRVMGRFPCPAGCGRTFDHAPAAVHHGKSCGGSVRAPQAPGPPVPLPATRRHVASTSSAWVAVCTDLLEAAKDFTNMRGLREPLVSRGFCCGSDRLSDGGFTVTVPPNFPCYYDVIGKEYASNQNSIINLTTLRKYLEGALALARADGAYRTDSEYKDARAATRVSAKTSRFTGVSWDEVRGKWRAAINVRLSTVTLGFFDDEEDAARARDAAVVKYELSRRTLNFPSEVPLASVLAALPPAPPPAPRRRSGRAPAPKVIVDPEAQVRRKARTLFPKKPPYYGKCIEGAQQKANGKWANREMFPGREFNDLDAYRAAKKQRKERRAAYSDQARTARCAH